MEKKVKILFDTSVLVSAMVEPHPMHMRALPWLKRAKSGEFDLIVASHTLAETYAVLTTLPVKPRISPATAQYLIFENIEAIAAKVVSLSPSNYMSTIKVMVHLGLSGGIIYDALIAKVAHKEGVKHLLTFNTDDFKRVWHEGEDILLIP